MAKIGVEGISQRGAKTWFGAFKIVARSSLPLISASSRPKLTFIFLIDIANQEESNGAHISSLFLKVYEWLTSLGIFIIFTLHNRTIFENNSNMRKYFCNFKMEFNFSYINISIFSDLIQVYA